MLWVNDYTNTIRNQLMHERNEQREELKRNQDILNAHNQKILK